MKSYSENTVRVVFYDRADFLVSSENIEMTDVELSEYLDAVIAGDLPESVSRIGLYSRTRPFRKITIDRRGAAYQHQT